ncbi:MAG: 3',5'-cyclic-nucleotide phosphodiesterase [Deltaproteobacteria bacterium]|nr:3',5'-cyclic-nucleotide phosphodiesterase [Deltaproteobacteria bacterium]
MKIKVLGCSGAEFPGRKPSGFLLDGKILFDAGSLTKALDIRGQRKVEYIFITHAHLDHVIGIPFLLDNMIVSNMWHRVNIIGIPHVVKTIRKNILNNSIWPDFTAIPDLGNGVVRFISLNPEHTLETNGYMVTPYKVRHSVPAAGYLIEDGKGKKVFYTGDTGPTSSTWKQLTGKKIDCLIIEVSFPEKMKDLAIKTGHLTPGLLKKEIEKIDPPPRRIYITHLKPQYFKTIQSEIKRLRIKNLQLLRDGEVFRI